MKESIKLMIVDDHDMFREMLSHLLSSQEGMELVGAFGTLADAYKEVSKVIPDLIILETDLPDGSGIEWASNIKANLPNIAVICLTTANTHENLSCALYAGIDGYVLKSSRSERLIDAIKAVSTREYMCYPSYLLSLYHRMHVETRPGTSSVNFRQEERLSRRENEIAYMISQGMTYREIAENTATSINTIKTHIRRIYERLGISSRRELTRYFTQSSNNNVSHP